MRIAFTTLGCKINQFETDVMRQDLLSRGSTIVPFEAEADIYVINTCSVTAKSDNHCRQAIRSAIQRANGAQVVVTGCYAATRPDEIRMIPGVGKVFGNHDKTMIADYLMPGKSSLSGQNRTPDAHARLKVVPARTRGFLKIQDGCDNRCSYCIVPLARGGSKSVPPEDVVSEFGQLVQAGFQEIVLTGIHIGTYGADLDKKNTLTEVVKTLLDARGQARIRLSSIEPREVTDELINFLGNGICRHLHIPLQSGDDAILSSMKRNYTAHFYHALLDKISKQVPGVALGADIMIGFPGEGEQEFQNTVRLVEETPLTHLHVFSYSPRPGTTAAKMNLQVPEREKKRRSEFLRTLGDKKNAMYRNGFIGKELSVVIENKIDPTTRLFTGLTDNYIRLHVRGSKSEHIGTKIEVRFTEINESNNFAVII